MIVLGLVVFAAAVAAAVILIAQNSDAMLNVHALGNSWNVHAYWLVVAGLVIAVVAIIALAMIRGGGARYRRLRREHRALVRDHERLADSYASEHPASEDVVDRPVGAHHEPVATMAQRPATADPAGSYPRVATTAPQSGDGPDGSGRLARFMRPRHRDEEGVHGQPTHG